LLALALLALARPAPLSASPRADLQPDHDHCTCAQAIEPASSAFAKASAVCAGTVLETIAPNDKPPYVEWTENLPGVAWHGFSVWRVSFAVNDSWKGVTTTTVTVRTQFGVDCGYRFAVGGQYLIYARQGRDGLETNVCTRTSELAAASTDLAFLQTQPGLHLTGSPSRFVFPVLAVLALLVLGGMALRWVRREAVSFDNH
jgi:hypothetical protein